MKKIVFIFMLLFLCVNIRVEGVQFDYKDYLKEIKNEKIIIGVQNKDESLQNFEESHLAKYLKEELNLNVKVKRVSEEEGMDDLVSQKIDFLENASIEDNPNIKYLNYNLLNNIIIVCRCEDKYNYTLNQLANKKVGIINKYEIKNYPIQLLSRNNNIKLYKNFNEMAKALEDKDIDIGISDKENRFELLLYNNITLAENRCNWSWKEGIASANPKYYKLIDIINNNIYKNIDLVNEFYDSEKDCKEKIKKAFYKSLSNEEKKYIKNNRVIKVLASKNSFPILYEETEKVNGLLNYYISIFSELTKSKTKYINSKDDNLKKENLIEEKIEYEKNDKLLNRIHTSNLAMISCNDENLDPGLRYIARTDKNIIGIPKQIRLNEDSELLRNKINYYENISQAIEALNNHKVNFILMERPTFDYYSLKDEGKNIIEFKELDIPAIYYLHADNETLNSILTKVSKIYDIEKRVNRLQWNNMKDYMQKKYIKAIYNRKQCYKFLIILFVSSLIIVIIFIIIKKNNMDVNKKLDGILKEDANLDIIEINLKRNEVKCKNSVIFNSSKKISLDEFLKIINLSREDYLNKDKVNVLKEPKKVLINGEVKYFKQCIDSLSSKKLISIITDVTKEVREKNELQEKIKIDNLTGLINRDYYEEEIEKIINKNSTYNGAFLFIDINDFKNFNDTYGHDFGDKVIKAVGDNLKSIEDDNTLAFRIAGDEFGVYKHKIKNEQEAEVFLKNLSNDLTIVKTYNDTHVNVSCSIGCAVSYESIKNIGMLRNLAEAQMYKCKKKKDSKSSYKI